MNIVLRPWGEHCDAEHGMLRADCLTRQQPAHVHVHPTILSAQRHIARRRVEALLHRVVNDTANRLGHAPRTSQSDRFRVFMICEHESRCVHLTIVSGRGIACRDDAPVEISSRVREPIAASAPSRLEWRLVSCLTSTRRLLRLNRPSSKGSSTSSTSERPIRSSVRCGRRTSRTSGFPLVRVSPRSAVALGRWRGLLPPDLVSGRLLASTRFQRSSSPRAESLRGTSRNLRFVEGDARALPLR